MKKISALLCLFLFMVFSLRAQTIQQLCDNTAATLATVIATEVAMGSQPESAFLNLPDINAINAKLSNPITLPENMTAQTNNNNQVKVTHTPTGIYSYQAYGSSNIETASVKPLKLIENYPNPFNPETTIKFYQQETSTASLSVYNLKGNFVAELFSGKLEQGVHEVKFNANGLPSGIYICRYLSNNQKIDKSIVLLK